MTEPIKEGGLIPADCLDRRVAGVNVVPGTLRDQLGDDLKLLVFLRHFGCIFCRETLADIQARTEADASFPEPLFFFQGRVAEGRAFLRRYGPQLRAVSDPEAFFYDAFGVGRAGLVKALGPSVWRARSRARQKGHENGERSGDIWRMPGAFLTRGKQVLWSHEFRHAADLPDFDGIARVATSVS